MILPELAEFIHENWLEAHRGAVQVGPYWVLFGNDGLRDPATTTEVEYVLRWLGVRKHVVCGFHCEGATWVIVAYPSGRLAPEKLTDMLFAGWDDGMRRKGAFGDRTAYLATQKPVALSRVGSPPVPARFEKALAELFPEATIKQSLACEKGSK